MSGGFAGMYLLISRPKGGFRCAYFRESGLARSRLSIFLAHAGVGFPLGFRILKHAPSARSLRYIILVSVQ